MTERDYYQNLLNLCKGGSDLYLHATTEASTPAVYDTFKYGLNTVIDSAHSVYKKMESNGWYQVKPVDITKIQEVECKFDCC